MTMMSSMNALPPIPPAGTSPIRAVLFDADGVLQIIGTPWRRALAEAGGEEFATRLLAEEGPTLEGSFFFLISSLDLLIIISFYSIRIA